MTESERNAYLAGFLDADGTFTISLNKSKVPRGRVEGYNSNREVLDWCHYHFGGRIELERPRRNSVAVGRWRLSSYADILRIVPPLVPYLIVKKVKAQLLIHFSNLVVSEMRPGRRYSEETLAKMWSMKHTMTFLNERGKCAHRLRYGL